MGAVLYTLLTSSVFDLPKIDPKTGTNISAIKSEADSTKITVMGRYFINPPIIPGQKSRGRKTIKVVTVDAIIGHDILIAACL